MFLKMVNCQIDDIVCNWEAGMNYA